MRKPVDPRNNGLGKPKKILLAKISIDLPLLPNTSYAIIAGPTIDFSSRILNLSYEYENPNYDAEKAEYDRQVGEYHKQLELFAKEEERKKNRAALEIDEQIERTEKRLANLKAMKEGQPLPYP